MISVTYFGDMCDRPRRLSYFGYRRELEGNRVTFFSRPPYFLVGFSNASPAACVPPYDF